MEDLDGTLAPNRAPSARRPLLGMTILVVEDSRYACEALRLMCLRSGARIRRADCLSSARRHLQVYRPSAVIVDHGLPDGSGLDLIAELNAATPRVGIIMGLSGDGFAASASVAAGADGFFEKPMVGLAAFQQALLDHLPSDRQPSGPRALSDEVIEPDPVAFVDDMAHAAALLEDCGEGPMMDYLAQFLGGVAHLVEDGPLAQAASDLARRREAGGGGTREAVARIAGLVQARLHQPAAQFS
ncbi:response regulator [Roseovarius sp. MMSF_3281]|uniref:response regulator n=1 Tax=Roseovarius sp. MMSF_3281 TaxID=3046694 RepID=UPI00273F3B06|nr:response regulator [Roseovarius sp. MMSF_3281]